MNRTKHIHDGVFGPHRFKAASPVVKTGRMTPKGRVHRYKTIMVLGKPTQVPVGRFPEKTEEVTAETAEVSR